MEQNASKQVDKSVEKNYRDDDEFSHGKNV